MAEYHHGDLPRQLLLHAATMAAETGPDSITLRRLARITGVTHSAPVHHFGTRQGLLTALAVQGFEELNEVLSRQTSGIYDMGVAYVAWALEDPGHYAVMWQPRLIDEQSAELTAARHLAWTLLSASVLAGSREARDEDSARTDAYAAFAMVHGLASIWLSGALPLPSDPMQLTREITRRLIIDGL